jgi:hypothetical protein
MFNCTYKLQMDKPTYKLETIEEGRIRIILSKDGCELGSLYYERAKRSFNRKPVGMDAWTCVEAKVEGLYDTYKELTPTEVMAQCQKLIRNGGDQK